MESTYTLSDLFDRLLESGSVLMENPFVMLVLFILSAALVIIITINIIKLIIWSILAAVTFFKKFDTRVRMMLE